MPGVVFPGDGGLSHQEGQSNIAEVLVPQKKYCITGRTVVLASVAGVVSPFHIVFRAAYNNVVSSGVGHRPEMEKHGCCRKYTRMPACEVVYVLVTR